MKIAFDGRRIIQNPSGLGVYSLQLVKALIRNRGEDKITVFLLPSANVHFSELADKVSVETVSWPVENHISGDIWKYFVLPRRLERLGASIFHDPAYQLPFLKTLRCKYFVTIHDLTPFKYPESNSLKYNLYWKTITLRSARMADAIITSSEFSRNEIIEDLKIAPDRVFTVPLGYSLEFCPGEISSEILTRYHLQQPYIMSTATYEPRKNLINSIQAFGWLKQRYHLHHHYVVAGRMGWKYEGILKEVQRLGLEHSIQFIGYVPTHDLVNIIRAAEVVVVPSLYEGFGLPVLESMACGSVVAASKTSSLPEVGGSAAVYFDPVDPEDIACKIYGLLSDDNELKRRRMMGLNHAKEFSWDRSASVLLGLYRRFADGKL